MFAGVRAITAGMLTLRSDGHWTIRDRFVIGFVLQKSRDWFVTDCQGQMPEAPPEAEKVPPEAAPQGGVARDRSIILKSCRIL